MARTWGAGQAQASEGKSEFNDDQEDVKMGSLMVEETNRKISLQYA